MRVIYNFTTIVFKMRLAIFLTIIFLLSGCSKKQNDDDLKLLVHKNYFSVSENNRKIDSIKNNRESDSLEIIEIREDKRYNDHYHIGAIHFIISDSSKSFYLINYLENPVLICGNLTALSREDSIKVVNKNILKIQKSTAIKTDDIIQILKKNKVNIVNNSPIPLQITFALKNDTLKGDTIYNIINFMEKNKMSLYDIRTINQEERNKISK